MSESITIPMWKRVAFWLLGVPVLDGVWEVRYGVDGKPIVLARVVEVQVLQPDTLQEKP